MIAVKKLHSMEEGQGNEKSFINEIQALTEIRHRIIVKLHGFCLHVNCMFLVYQYIERGNLTSILSEQDKAMELDWIRRVNIMKDASHALSYMHHDCSPANSASRHNMQHYFAR